LSTPRPPAPTLCNRSDDSCASSRVHLTDRSPVTAGLRFRFTGPVAPVTGRNRSNSNLNSKKLSSTGSYRYTDRLDRFTGRFDRFTGRFDRFEFKSKFKIACVTGLERYTGRFDRFTKWALMDRLIFFLFFFGLTLNAQKVC